VELEGLGGGGAEEGGHVDVDCARGEEEDLEG